MFVREKHQVNGKVTILIVENVRESGKVHQKILRRVATVLPHEVAQFRESAEYIKAKMEIEREPNLFPAPTLAQMVISSRKRSESDDSPLPVNMRNLREEARIVSGIHEIYGSLYDEIGFSRVFKQCPVSPERYSYGPLSQTLQQTFFLRTVRKGFWDYHCPGEDLPDDGYIDP